MADTATNQLKLLSVRGPVVQTNAEAALGEGGAQPDIRENRAALPHHLSRLEQIVEYLKVLYR